MALTETQLVLLYRTEMPALYGYVSRRTGGDQALTEDIVQETFLRAVRAWRRDGLPPVPPAWLRRVAHNLLMSHFRRKQPSSLEAHGLQVADEWPLESPDEAALVNWGLSQLADEQAGLIEAFHFDRKSLAQIATEMKISSRAVEGRLYRARRALRDLLSPQRPNSETGNDRPAPTRS